MLARILRVNTLVLAQLKRLLAGGKITVVRTRAASYHFLSTCATRFSSAWPTADQASTYGRRLLSDWTMRRADWSNPLRRCRVRSRILAARTKKHLGRWRKCPWAISLQLKAYAGRSRSLAEVTSRWKALEHSLRQINWATLHRWSTKLESLWRASEFIERNWRSFKSLAPIIRRITGLASRLPGLTRTSGTLRDGVVRLGHSCWTNAISTWQMAVAKLSVYAMHWGLAMARNAGSDSPSPFYLWSGKEFILVDPACPIGYFRQFRSARALDEYMMNQGVRDQDEEVKVEEEYASGYVSQVLVEPTPRQVKPAEFHPQSFLLILFDAYSKVVENRAGDVQDFAPVVALVDVYAWVTSLQEPNGGYSKQEFTRDIYRLHASGVDTTEDGAKVSFPISRGVRGKTLTTTNETGGEVRYYGIRFLQRTPVAQA